MACPATYWTAILAYIFNTKIKISQFTKECKRISLFCELRIVNGKNMKIFFSLCLTQAEMMKAHREMVLDGYDVYRFGGKELYVGKDENEIPAKQTVFDFLDGLFKKYRILPKIE